MVTADLHHRDIDFPGKDQAEEFQFYFRQHWIRLWTPTWHVIVWTILTAILAFILQRTFSTGDVVIMRRISLMLLAMFFLYTQLGFLAKFYKYFLYVIIVTDKKIHRIKKTLLIVDDHQSIDLWTLEDITKNQHGLIQNLLGFGTLVLVMQTQDALRIHFTPFIATKHELIMQLREHARHRMSPQQFSQQFMQSVEPAATVSPTDHDSDAAQKIVDL